jgi:AhpD family alkylhydroperoxidase
MQLGRAQYTRRSLLADVAGGVQTVSPIGAQAVCISRLPQSSAQHAKGRQPCFPGRPGRRSPAGAAQPAARRRVRICSPVPSRLVDLVFLRVSQINGRAYCIDMHSRALLRAGT